MNVFLDPFQYLFMRHAALEMFFLSILCAVVGTYAIVQGLAFLTSALTHAIFPGIVIAFLLAGFGPVFWGGALSGLIIVGLIFGFSRNRQINESTAISVFYVGALALGVVLISRAKGEVVQNLDNFLFGQLFGVGLEDIAITAGVCVLLVMLFSVLRKELVLVSFDRNMARAMGLPVNSLEFFVMVALVLTVMGGFPAVGNILMIALIVTPAATARLLSNRIVPIMVIACADAIIASVIGLYVSYYGGLAPGAVIVTSLTVLFLLALVAAPAHGVLAGWLNRRNVSRITP